MIFPIPPQYSAAIARQYEKNMSRYRSVREEVDAFLQGKNENFSLCLQYLYGHMAAQDVLSHRVEIFADFVTSTLEACGKVDYLRAVPAELFFPYVLYHRVNSEYLDQSRGLLLEQLLPYVQGKTMEQAALAVNYWCYAHATYTPADDRTLGPLAMLRRTLGRCGEESVLAVAALRSVGLPARQCYCPRWSHCDDNHAWVEVWIDGEWRYMGACEPEAKLDRGWFTAAASRAMLVDTKCWAGDALYEAVNCTARYTDAKILTVLVTDGGRPVSGARVQFQVVNYSELFTLWEEKTDEFGLARFVTGPGDLFICARHGEKFALKTADLRKQASVTLELGDAFPDYLEADLVAPEDSSHAMPYEDDDRHRALLRQCQAHLAARRATFSENEGYLRLAAGNAGQIRAFLEDSRYPLSHKEELLSTLREKDFVDISREALEDALDAAAPARGQFDPDIFRDFILAPRVADEMLLPQRQLIRGLFPGGFSDPRQIYAWMRENLEILPDEGVSNYFPSAYGCLRHRQVPAFAFDTVFVTLCRAFCFPARLAPHTMQAQWLDADGMWQDLRSKQPDLQLTLEFSQGQKLNYGEHISIAAWNGADFVTLQYPELMLNNRHTFFLQPGLHRITVTTRQIDGTASVKLWHMALSCDKTLSIMPPADQTAQRLKQILLDLPEGALRKLWQANRNQLLIFADPGSEPTEHLLTEMLDLSREFQDLNCRILLLTNTPGAMSHPTVARLREKLPQLELCCLRDPEALAVLHLQMRACDLRLPFVVCVDSEGRGVYADANYRIRMAQTLLQIQKLLNGIETIAGL